LFQNISKNGSTKVNIFGLNFNQNTSTFINQFLFIFWDEINMHQL
jgi:hypothetical protein